MQALKRFVWTTILGGLGVLLPIVLFCFLAQWLAGVVADLIAPLTDLAQEGLRDASWGRWRWAINGLVVLGLIGLCFAIGFLVRTRLGGFLHRLIEVRLLARIPGYGIIKETVHQFVGGKQSPFASVALVDLLGVDAWCTAFVTDASRSDLITVFVPTGPNPTSGNIFHIAPERVRPVAVPVEKAMRSIISCGAGSADLVAAMRAERSPGADPAP